MKKNCASGWLFTKIVTRRKVKKKTLSSFEKFLMLCIWNLACLRKLIPHAGLLHFNSFQKSSMPRKLIEVLCIVYHLNAGIDFGENVYTVLSLCIYWLV